MTKHADLIEVNGKQYDALTGAYLGSRRAMDQLNQAAAAKGWTSSQFSGFPRKKEAPVAADKRTANSVNIAISGPTYNTHYDYDGNNNRYLRSMLLSTRAARR